MKKILFIINPISGNHRKIKIPRLIERHLDKSMFTYEIKYTKYPKHATEIASEAVEQKIDIVVAVGGDGTANETSKALINTNIALGIIPLGSGNGLARYLDIPLLPIFAIRNLNRQRTKKIDTLLIDNYTCVNMAGIGFDAHIAHLFAKHKKRGFRSYLDIILKEFKRFKSKKTKVSFDNQTIEENAFLVSFANSTQFGNAAHIAPKASASDGKLDISILQKFPLVAGIDIGSRLFLKNIDKSKFSKEFKTEKIKVEVENGENTIEGHIDGECYFFSNPFEVTIQPHSLKVIKGIKIKPAGRKTIMNIKHKLNKKNRT